MLSEVAVGNYIAIWVENVKHFIVEELERLYIVCVAQWIRHLASNQVIAGSSPATDKFFCVTFYSLLNCFVLSGELGSSQWCPGSGGELQLRGRARGQVCGRGCAGGAPGQVDSEGRARGARHQDPAPPQTGLGLLHPQEPGHDAGLC